MVDKLCIKKIREEFKKLANPAKTNLARKYAPQMPFSRLQYLLQIGQHEERLCALLMLIGKFDGDSKKITVPPFLDLQE